MSRAIVFRNKNNEKVYPCSYYPIGSVYISFSSIDPSAYFGGSWERIKGRFLLSADDNTYKTDSTGGEATHKLTINEMPSHSHTLNKNVPYGMPYNDTSGTACGSGGGVYYHESYSPFSIANSGGNQAHNNMPPYVVVYMWSRTA